MKTPIFLLGGIALFATSLALAEHPQLITTPAERGAIQKKIQDAEWARNSYAALRARIDPLVEKTMADRQFVTSRMLMNWETHYTTTLVEKSRTVGGEGRAAIPTPRFEGARNWANSYSLPEKIEDWQPFNDRNGKLCLKNNSTGKMEWVAPGDTGGNIRSAQQKVLGLAADAAFLHWVSGDENYARFASDILCMWMDGFSATTAPRAVTPDAGMEKVIGSTTFEVIHENAVISAALAYDFLQPYLEKQGRDTKGIQNGFKRWANRVIDGGGRDGNWNLNQAMMIAYAGLALEPNASYPDGKGREYYANVVLNADLPAQKGITLVMKDGFDPETMLWPEAAGYGFGSAVQIIELASLLSTTPEGETLLTSPEMVKSLINQGEMLHPNGLSNGVGDTTNTRMGTDAMENLLAAAIRRGDTSVQQTMAACLRREIASGNYDRSKLTGIYPLARFASELPATDSKPTASRSFFFPGLNILMLRNPGLDGNPATSLSAAVYGTNGGHVHPNGLAMELYGAGVIQGADPGRGSSYWTPDHREYYVSPVAHNTVVVNGSSSYSEYKDPNKSMKIESAEPASQRAALSPEISFVRASFSYSNPAATQERTLALIRTGGESGFYFDVFRSKAVSAEGEFHDYFYHNMGTLSTVSKPLSPSTILSDQKGLMKGYSYFKNEKSATVEDGLKATFTLDLPGKPAMDVWLPFSTGRSVFSLDAPQNNAIRTAIAENLRGLPMPTLLIRQQGEAWLRPFVSVYEPYSGSGNTIVSVRNAATGDISPSLVATLVEGHGYQVRLFQDASPDAVVKIGETLFQGDFGAIIQHGGQMDQLYLGNGKILKAGSWSIKSGPAASVSIRRTGKGWIYSSSSPVEINGRSFPAASGQPIEAAAD